ncbi:MAG: DUF4097 family beta strand repeat-containing protein [Gaiellaceae bacterium]
MRSETFQTPGEVFLRVKVPAGRVDVETVEGDETHVELEGSEEVEQATVIEARGGEVVVEVEERRLLFLRSSQDARVRITCPLGARIEFKGIAADLAVRGSTGPVTVKTVSGDAELGRVEGDLEMKSVSGDLAVEAVTGRATLQTVSGDVRLDDAGGPVTVQTVSGDQRLGAVVEGAVVLKSVSGDLHVGIRAGSSLWVDAKSVSGDTSSELAVGDTPPEGAGPLIELRATAMSGDIRIVRA